jgi:hypothetical protein
MVNENVCYAKVISIFMVVIYAAMATFHTSFLVVNYSLRSVYKIHHCGLCYKNFWSRN